MAIGRHAGPATLDLDRGVAPSHGAIVESLAAAVEAKDADTGSHLYRSAFLALGCLDVLAPGLSRSDEVVYGFVLHDVGKIGIPDAILGKADVLTDEEWRVMRRHPEIGLEIVAPLGLGDVAEHVIIAHHERWDGLGYPFGLAGEEIPLVARVFAVADTYDALTSDRSYRDALHPNIARRLIAEESGKAFDPDVVAAFLSSLR